MAKLALKKGSTDVSVYLFAQDSSKTTGAGLTGLAYNTASLTAYYVRPLGSATQITLATQTVTGNHSDGGFVEVDATNMPGVYRLDLPDAVCATGVPSAVVMLKGATNLAPVLLEIQLTDFDLNDATPNVSVSDIAADAINAGAVKADAVTKIQNGLATPTNITSASGVELKSTQGKITWDQQKIVADVAYEGALHIENTNDNGVGQGNIGVYAGQVNSGVFGQVNESTQDNGVAQYNVAAGIDGIAQKNEATQPSGINVSGHDPALSTDSHLQDVENKLDLLDTNSVMSFTIDGFTLEQIVQIMAASLAGKLTRTGNTLTFRDLADTLDRIIAETDANKNRTNVTLTV